jgi:glycosyltransferase involved in cell wall biosynthesis
MLEQTLDKSSVSEAASGKGRNKSDIKIAQVISRLCMGGTPIAVILATEFLLDRGYPIVLVTGRVTNDEMSIEEFAILRGVHPVSIRSLSKRDSLWSDLKSLWQLISFFRRERPKIVHTHTAKAGALGRIAARVAGVPICVHTFHGHVFHGHFRSVKSRVYLQIERMLAWWTDCLVAVSQSQGRELVEKYRVAPPGKFVTIAIDFNMSRYLRLNGYRGPIRRQSSCITGSVLIGWAGRLAPVKNPALFIEVAALVAQAYPKARFAIVGDGELRGQLELLVRERNMSETIELIGWQSDLSDFYADIDLLVMTSRQEGTPLALLEAMASGKPFVSTDVGGICDLMAEAPESVEGMRVSKNGILTDPSAASLAKGIAYLLDRPSEALQMGRAGRSFVSDAFAEGHSGSELENLYLKLLKQKRLWDEPGTSASNPA